MDVIKTLRPGTSGTKKLSKRYGDRLVCVRYRKDAQKNRRYTTIELIIDESPLDQAKQGVESDGRSIMVGIYIALGDSLVRQRVIEAGGEYDQLNKLWKLPLAQVVKLGLVDRLRQA